MKRRLAWMLCGVIALSVLLVGCGEQPVQPSSAPSSAAGEPEASDGPQTAAPTPGGEAGAEYLKAGIWLASGGVEQYYFFDEGSGSGRRSAVEDGEGIAFAYSYRDGKAQFTMGGAGEALTCAVERQGEDVMVFRWGDGTEETLRYISEEGSDTFRFYSNQDLESMALSYYGKTTGEPTDELMAEAVTGEDGKVHIQVYRNLGDHNSTAAWYTVERTTGAGTDDNMGTQVNLAEVS